MKTITDRKREEMVELMTAAVRDIPDQFVDAAFTILAEVMKASLGPTPSSSPQAADQLGAMLRQLGFVEVAMSTDRSELDVQRIEIRAAEIASAWFTYDEDQWNETLWAPLPCPDCEREAHELAREIAGVMF